MTLPTRRSDAVLAVAVAMLLAACAAEVPARPARLAPLAQATPDLALSADVPVLLSTGYTRTVPQQVRWRAIGALAEGTVYQPVDSVFAIEGRNVHEAYLVVDGNALKGFYLPAENRFSVLAQPISLPLQRGLPR